MHVVIESLSPLCVAWAGTALIGVGSTLSLEYYEMNTL